ncbi:hypothetical protein IPG41_04735 [Candidatus Peregrinibacteria bacterium]|nr:MAG: hypothetical protein IPG41_04735 [Candidatus Peregrinibacteria bacterium]
MTTLAQKPLLREVLIFAGLLGAALFISSFFAEPSFATSLISPEDNPSAVSSLTGGESDLKTIVKTILNFALSFLGFLMVLMVIYAGVLYVTAAGNEENVGKAKKILMYCAIGTILIFVSFAFVNTLLGAASDGAAGTTTTTGIAN